MNIPNDTVYAAQELVSTFDLPNRTTETVSKAGPDVYNWRAADKRPEGLWPEGHYAARAIIDVLPSSSMITGTVNTAQELVSTSDLQN
ncbi:hypothetical protein DPMN_094149, partial [Dreissena polymorpha]